MPVAGARAPEAGALLQAVCLNLLPAGSLSLLWQTAAHLLGILERALVLLQACLHGGNGVSATSQRVARLEHALQSEAGAMTARVETAWPE